MLHKSTKIIATIGALVFLGCLVVAAVFFTMVAKQKVLYTERNQELAQKKTDQEALRTLLHTLDETKSERESLLSRILKEEDVINFLSLLESVGSGQGAKITTNSLRVESINDTFETLIMSVEVEGSYASVTQTLKLFENLPYQTLINTMQLSRAEGSGGLIWKGMFDLRVTKFKKI